MERNFKTKEISISSGATSSSGINLGNGWDSMYLEIPTFTSGGTQYIQGSSDGSTFRRIYAGSDDSAGVHAEVYQLPQAVQNCIVPLPATGLKHIKLENTTGVTDATTSYKLIFG